MCQNNSAEREKEKILGGHRRRFSRDHRQRGSFRLGISTAVQDGSAIELFRNLPQRTGAPGNSWLFQPPNKSTVHLLELLADGPETMANAR